MKHKIDIAHYTHQGRRNENQDRVFTGVRPGEPFVVVVSVADGLGGHHKGEVAAELAVKKTKEILEKGRFLYGDHDHNRIIINEAILEVNRQIFKMTPSTNFSEKMGTTLTGTVLVEDSYYVFNIGDSRTYCITDENIQCLTVDHTAAWEAMKNGIITESELSKTPYANELLRSLGVFEHVHVDIFPVEETTAYPIEQDLILLSCSDGLWNQLTAEEIWQEVCGRQSLDSSLKNLASLSYIKGSTDNISIAALESGKIQRKNFLKETYQPLEELSS